MEEVWLFIGLVVTGCIVVITFYFALVLREVFRNLQDLRGTVKNMNTITTNLIREQEIVDDVLSKVQSTANEVSESIAQIKSQFLVPFTFISSLVQSLRQHFEKRGEESEEVEE